MALDPRFEISIAKDEEMDGVMRLMEKAFGNDEIWKYTTEHCDPEEVHEWIMTNLTQRWLMPDITTYKVTEVATGKLAGWTALQFPWKWCNEGDERYMNADNRALALSHDMPPLVKGMDKVAMEEFFHALTATSEFGYDPETDYHRKGTMIHVDFQKRGLGTALTRYTNTIADKTGVRTWAPARPTSIKMFLNEGFTLRGEIDAHLERWGGDREKSISKMVCRDPPA